jgi:hypothetical protein
VRRILLNAALLVMVAATPAFAASNISSTDKYAWGQNAGWQNAYADGTNGVVVTPDLLAGCIWCENVGWICVGGGTPVTPPHYSNTSAADYGVNHDGTGNLSGYGWGENIGWVAFDTSGTGGSRVTINPAGEFSGYAWSENIGWINMASGYGVRLADTDSDGLPDAFETDTGTFHTAYDTGTDPTNPDTDGDGFTDGDEIAAATDPMNPHDYPGAVPGLSVVGALALCLTVTFAAWRRAA